MIRSLAARILGLPVKAHTAARHGMALIANHLANILWNIDNTWTQLVKQTYGRNAVVYACVRILCTSVPEAPLKCYTEKGDERIELPKTHPLRQLIRRPNELMTEYEMMELAVIHLAVVGRTVWWKERNNGGKPIAMWPLRPDRVGPVYSTSDNPGERVLAGWAYLAPDEGTPVLIPRRDAFTVNFPDPDGESGGIAEGLGPLSVLRYEVAADNKATDHVGALLANYAQPGVALKIDRELDTETAAIIKANFRREFGGAKLGTPAILDANAEIQILGFSLKDLEFPGLRANAEARICGAFGVPPILAGVHVGLVESSQRANTKELRELFAETTVASYWRRFADQFTEDLAAEFGEGIVCEFDTSGVKALAGQFAEHLAPWKEAAAGAYITVNEYRTKLGVDPLPLEIGDVLYVPNTVTAIPATEAARAAFDKQQKLQATAQDAAEAKLLEQQEEERLALPPGENGENGEDDESAKKSANLKAIDPRDAAENRMRLALEALFAKLAGDIADRIERGEVVDDALLTEAFGRVIEPQLVEVATAEGVRIAAEIQVQFDPAIVSSAMSDWAATYNYELVKGLTDTTQKTLRKAMSKFASTPGMTRGELEALLEPVFGAGRAESIAVTEVTRASSAAMSQYQTELEAAGILMGRKWRTLNDELVCPVCGPLNGQPESEWAAQYPGGPPAHSRCRCSVTLSSQSPRPTAKMGNGLIADPLPVRSRTRKTVKRDDKGLIAEIIEEQEPVPEEDHGA